MLHRKQVAAIFPQLCSTIKGVHDLCSCDTLASCCAVQAEVSGTVVKVLAENGKPVSPGVVSVAGRGAWSLVWNVKAVV